MPVTRPLSFADVAAFCELRKAALLDTPWAFLAAPGDDRASDPASVAQWLGADDKAILTVVDEAEPSSLLAIAGVSREPHLKRRHRATIWGVYCAAGARGCGHGRAVVMAAIAAARRWPGVEIVDLSVSSGSKAALALYRSLGFEAWGTEPDSIRIDGEAFDEIYLQLRL